jgi:hypothetical protein
MVQNRTPQSRVQNETARKLDTVQNVIQEEQNELSNVKNLI